MTAKEKHDAEVAAVAVAEAKRKEAEIAQKRAALLGKQTTVWMAEGANCGPTSYDCKTNVGWCRCEVARLRGKGLNACLVEHEGHVAVFKLDKGETRADVVRAINEIDLHIRGCDDGETGEEVQNG